MKHTRTQANRHGKTPFARSALACALLAVSATSAKAEASAEELQRIKLYGLVSIAEDKLDSWGPWSAFEAPAAGESTATPTPRVNNGDVYRPLAQPTTPTTSFGLGCVGGSLCGFGAISSSENINNSYTNKPQSAVQFTGTAVAPSELSPLLPQAIRLQGTLLGEGAPLLFPDSGVLTLEFNEGEGYGIRYFREAYAADESGGEYVSLSGSAYNQQHDVVNAQVAKAYLDASISAYVEGTGEQPATYSNKYTGGPVVIGYATSDADMSALRASNATASYYGYGGNYGGGVNIEVQFGQGTWQGTWNGGRDGYVNAKGGQLVGNVGLTAAGTISGANFTSTTVGSNDVGATVTGFVRGAFFGPQAAAAAGVVDITKTNPGTLVQPERALAQPAMSSVPQLVIGTPGYTEARHVSTFLTTRVDNSEK